MSDEVNTSRPGSSLSLWFRRLLICLPLVCSFLPSSITLETLLLLVGKISGLKPDHQKGSANHYLDLEETFCFLSMFWFLKHRGIMEVVCSVEIPQLLKCPCTAITNVPSLLSDVLVWKALTFISREACPGAFFFMSVSSISSILSSQNQGARKSTCPRWIVGLTSGLPSSEHRDR